MLVFTIGHSTRSLDDFVALLKEHDVARLIDVRRDHVRRSGAMALPPAPGRHQAHALNPRARAQSDGTVRYPASDQLDLL